MAYPNLPKCCNDAITAEVSNGLEVFDGQIIECPQCQRGLTYYIVTGWTRYWKPCDRCGKSTTFERKNESEPPEGERCQFCGNWVCSDCSPCHTESLLGNSMRQPRMYS